MPRAIDAALRRQLPGMYSAGPTVLALHAPVHRDLLLAEMPAAKPEWTPASQWLSRQRFASAPVVPLSFCGKSRSPQLRVGQPIEPATLAEYPDAVDQLRYVRWRISLLRTGRAGKPPSRRTPEPIAQAGSPADIQTELAALSPDCRLAGSGEFEVFLAASPRIPHTLAEIGRLREIAFRAAGEGTGRAYDLDRFDHDYLHLFVWNHSAREIAGAYRLRLTDGHPDNLYTATLFRYGPEFLHHLGPAIELGRSFIRLEYQKSFHALLLLWKGIGQFVARHPDHKTLFGPVSISNQYQAVSRELMIAFLEKRELLADLARFVRPRQAPSRRAAVTADYCRSLDDLSHIVAGLEPGRQGVPVLLRHYLRLGGKLLGFNVDRNFANALDGLIVVDLTHTEPRLLDRYLGKDEAAALLAHHQRKGNHGTLQDS